jgi:flagellar basal-body rod protein FlgB
MKISLDNALGIHPDALSLRSERTSLLARNIAQADTPGYKARDLDFESILAEKVGRQLPQVHIAGTDPRHLSRETNGPSGYDIKYRIPLMPSLDGNTVDMQTEQAKFAENNTRLLASLRFVDGRFNSLRTALRGE